MTQAHGDSFGRNLAVTLLEFLKLLTEYGRHVPPESGGALGDGVENRGLPDKRRGRPGRLVRRTMAGLGKQTNRPDYLPGGLEPENHFGAVLAKLHDFRGARSKQHDLANRITVEENRLAASKGIF